MNRTCKEQSTKKEEIPDNRTKIISKCHILCFFLEFATIRGSRIQLYTSNDTNNEPMNRSGDHYGMQWKTE